MRNWIAALWLLAACSAPAGRPETIAPVAAGRAQDLAGAAQTITAEEMRAHIAYLASDELRGRNTPSPGLELAAAYLARAFAEMGLSPAGDSGTFIQRYAFPLRALETGAARFEVHGPQGQAALAYGADYFAMPGVPGAASGAVVFTSPSVAEAAAGGALRGKIALTYLPGSPGTRDWQLALRRARRAVQEADAGALVIALPAEVTTAAIAENATRAAQPQRVIGELQDVAVFFVRYEPARELLQQSGQSLDALRQRRDAFALPLEGVSARLAAPSKVLEEARPPNVVALLPGSDPALRETYIVFSAHMDHVGVGRPDASGDSIYNGADDDASGTAAITEVAQAFAALARRPARSLIFLAVSGEEKGLLGSRYFTEHPTVPLERVVANINLDMIGRNAPDSIVVIGQEYSSLGPLVLQVAAEQHADVGLTVSRDPWPEERFFFRSDHYNFARKEIPALFFFAGVHEDYHRPSDEVEKIDADKAARVARLVFYTGHALATHREAPRWTEEGLAEVRALTR